MKKAFVIKLKNIELFKEQPFFDFRKSENFLREMWKNGMIKEPRRSKATKPFFI